MRQSNNVTEFIFLSLTQDPTGHKELFIMFLLMYIVTTVGNLLIVVTIIASSSLSSLMYFFLAFLSLVDAVYSTANFPKLLKVLECEKKIISFIACLFSFLWGTYFVVLRSS